MEDRLLPEVVLECDSNPAGEWAPDDSTDRAEQPVVAVVVVASLNCYLEVSHDYYFVPALASFSLVEAVVEEPFLEELLPCSYSFFQTVLTEHPGLHH